MHLQLVPPKKRAKTKPSTALRDLVVPFGTEYLYVAVSKQKPGVIKAGRTGRSPFVRATEFSDISELVTWTIAAVIPVLDSVRAETLMKSHLDAEAERDLAGKELWVIGPGRAEELARKAAARTPARARAKRLWAPANAAVARRNPLAWKLALAMPVRCKPLCPEPLTLAELMGFMSIPGARQAAERGLRKNGVVLTSFDEHEPRFHVYADENSPLTNWVNANGLDWEQFGTQVGGCIAETFDIVPLDILETVATFW